MQTIQDPRLITQPDFPFHFVFSQQATSLIAWMINWKTKANYDHVMSAINEGKFITQDFSGYHEVDMAQYLKKGGELKFVKLKNANKNFNLAFRSTILNHLALPWYKKIYDYGNILGRAIGLDWVHLPGTYDCSEISLWVVKKCAMYLPHADANLIMNLPDRASPDDIDYCVKMNSDVFTIYGEWQADEGVVV